MRERKKRGEKTMGARKTFGSDPPSKQFPDKN